MDASERERGFRGQLTRLRQRLEYWNHWSNEWLEGAALYFGGLLVSLVLIVLGAPFFKGWANTPEARDAQISLFFGFWLGVGAALLVVWLV